MNQLFYWYISNTSLNCYSFSILLYAVSPNYYFFYFIINYVWDSINNWIHEYAILLNISLDTTFLIKWIILLHAIMTDIEITLSALQCTLISHILATSWTDITNVSTSISLCNCMSSGTMSGYSLIIHSQLWWYTFRTEVCFTLCTNVSTNLSLHASLTVLGGCTHSWGYPELKSMSLITTNTFTLFS